LQTGLVDGSFAWRTKASSKWSVIRDEVFEGCATKERVQEERSRATRKGEKAMGNDEGETFDWAGEESDNCLFEEKTEMT